MNIGELISIIEERAPLSLAEEWDNPGLIIEPLESDIRRVLVALDCTVEVAREAAEKGAQLVLTHHPLFFKPVRRLSYNEPETAAACMLVRSGIGLYAAHTNLDRALGGVNDALAKKIGLTDITGLSPGHTSDEPSCGRVGMLEAPMKLCEFAALVRDRLGTAVRYGGDGEKAVRRIAVIGGSGGELLREARGADALVTGEVKHSAAIDAAFLGIGIVEAGHYETESVIIKPWIAGLQKAVEELQCRLDLLEATSGGSPLIAP